MGFPGRQGYYLEQSVDAGLAVHGGDRRSEEFQGCDTTLKTAGGTSSEYLMRDANCSNSFIFANVAKIAKKRYVPINN
jgi:hypothetical protein